MHFIRFYNGTDCILTGNLESILSVANMLESKSIRFTLGVVGLPPMRQEAFDFQHYKFWKQSLYDHEHALKQVEIWNTKIEA